MRRIELHARVHGRSAVDVYNILSDLEGYPSCASSVRSLAILERGENRIVSSWEVAFHNGVLQWTEEDRLFPDQLLFQFRQIEGDADYFAGEWKAVDDGDGCSLRFSAEFDLGLPTLDATLGPIAEAALRDNIRSIVFGLLGDSTQIVEADPDAKPGPGC
jgi:ribosome-associated toxin RatA of RatAB toxin-antitoxin module